MESQRKLINFLTREERFYALWNEELNDNDDDTLYNRIPFRFSFSFYFMLL